MTVYIEMIIGIAIGAGAGAVSTYFADKRRDKIHKLNLLRSFRDTRKMLLLRAVDETNCANALILRIHNGGGKLSDGKNWYSSVVAEAPERRQVSAFASWQNVIVQDSYKELIRSVREKKTEYLYTDKMPAGDLRTAYEAFGVIGSVVIELYSDEYHYYYMSFPVREHWDDFTLSADQHMIKSTAHQMQEKYETFGALGVLKYDIRY